MAYFDGIKVGDRVYEMQYGWGIVIQVDRDSFLGIEVEFEDGRSGWLTFDGKFDEETNQVLFWSKPEFTPPPRPKRRVKKPVGVEGTVHDGVLRLLVPLKNGTTVRLTGEYEVEE